MASSGKLVYSKSYLTHQFMSLLIYLVGKILLPKQYTNKNISLLTMDKFRSSPKVC